MSLLRALRGVMYRMEMPFRSGVWISLMKIGRRTASVFPLPVGAMRRTFFPSRIGGIALVWGSVGWENPSSARALTTGLGRSEKTEPSEIIGHTFVKPASSGCELC